MTMIFQNRIWHCSMSICILHRSYAIVCVLMRCIRDCPQLAPQIIIWSMLTKIDVLILAHEPLFSATIWFKRRWYCSMSICILHRSSAIICVLMVSFCMRDCPQVAPQIIISSISAAFDVWILAQVSLHSAIIAQKRRCHCILSLLATSDAYYLRFQYIVMWFLAFLLNFFDRYWNNILNFRTRFSQYFTHLTWLSTYSVN